MSLLRHTLAIACFFTFLAAAQFSQAEDVQPATHTAPVRQPESSTTASIQFSQQPAQVGDRVGQQVDLELNLNTSIIQAGQLAHQEETSMIRRQQRLVEVLEVAEGNVRRARVTFTQSRLKSPENDDPEQEVIQPVEGKNYLLTRQGEQLLVTDGEGTIPPRDEFEIVFSSMQSLGLPNPLAQFLLGRTIQVGQTLELPREIAERMLSLGNELGEVKRFELQLQEMSTYGGEPCAVFAAKIEVAGGAGSPMQIDVTGSVVILTESCRTVVTDLSGPISFNETQLTSQGNYQYQGTGTMRAAVRARYAGSAQ